MKDEQLFTEINITPLTDMIMVLMIIFIITATAFTQTGIDINLPQAAHADQIGQKSAELSIDRGSRIFLNDTPAEPGSLEKSLRELAAQKYSTLIIRADHAVPYGFVIEVMDRARGAGFSDIAFSVVKK